MKLKLGVNQRDIKPPVWYAIGLAEGIFGRFGCVLVVTSLRDPDAKRVSGSLHAEGLAVDLRARMNSATRKALLGALIDALNPLGFDVILHGEAAALHFHVEYQPKAGENWQATVA